MKLYLIIFLILFAFNSDQTEFEGELTYTVKYSGIMKVNGQTFDIGEQYKKRRDSYDKIVFKIKGNNFIKFLNKQEPEKKLFLAQEKKVYIISNETNLMIDDLTYQNLFDRENNYLGDIVDLNVKDTVFKDYSEDLQLYPQPIRDVVGKSIILYYEILLSKSNLKTQIELLKIDQTPIPDSEFNVPEYKEDRKSKKFNKFSERFKIYQIVQD